MSDLSDDIDRLDAAVAELKAALWDDLERLVAALNRHLIYIGMLIKGAK